VLNLYPSSTGHVVTRMRIVNFTRTVEPPTTIRFDSERTTFGIVTCVERGVFLGVSYAPTQRRRGASVPEI